ITTRGRKRKFRGRVGEGCAVPEETRVYFSLYPALRLRLRSGLDYAAPDGAGFSARSREHEETEWTPYPPCLRGESCLHTCWRTFAHLSAAAALAALRHAALAVFAASTIFAAARHLAVLIVSLCLSPSSGISSLPCCPWTSSRHGTSWRLCRPWTSGRTCRPYRSTTSCRPPGRGCSRHRLWGCRRMGSWEFGPRSGPSDPEP